MSGTETRTDEELILALRSGDGNAEEELYTRYKQQVRRKARAYFLIGADKEDVIQEGMIGLYKAVCDFAPDRGSSFRSFADLCIERQIMSAVKAATRKKHSPLNSYVSLSSALDDGESERTLMELIAAAETAEPEAILIDRENCEFIVKELDTELTKLEKQVLTLYIDGLSYQQIAIALERGTKSVDNALQRVKKKLEEGLRRANG